MEMLVIEKDGSIVYVESVMVWLIFSMPVSCLVPFFRNRPPGSSLVRRVDFPMLLVFVSPRQPCWCCYQPGSLSNTSFHNVGCNSTFGASLFLLHRYGYRRVSPIVCLSSMIKAWKRMVGSVGSILGKWRHVRDRKQRWRCSNLGWLDCTMRTSNYRSPWNHRSN